MSNHQRHQQPLFADYCGLAIAFGTEKRPFSVRIRVWKTGNSKTASYLYRNLLIDILGVLANGSLTVSTLLMRE